MVKFCKYCLEHPEYDDVETTDVYMAYLNDDVRKCPCCGNELEDIDISKEDFRDIFAISEDLDFMQAMIQLKQDDIIEYQSRMSQFRIQLQERENSKTENDTTPKCPHCKSTNIKPIPGLNRGASIVMWGIFSKKINKSFECKNCGYTW